MQSPTETLLVTFAVMSTLIAFTMDFSQEWKLRWRPISGLLQNEVFLILSYRFKLHIKSFLLSHTKLTKTEKEVVVRTATSVMVRVSEIAYVRCCRRAGSQQMMAIILHGNIFQKSATYGKGEKDGNTRPKIHDSRSFISIIRSKV